ncbi:hypothetical protein ALC62_03466, partial [Cyphomyrmex costatus]
AGQTFKVMSAIFHYGSSIDEGLNIIAPHEHEEAYVNH